MARPIVITDENAFQPEAPPAAAAAPAPLTITDESAFAPAASSAAPEQFGVARTGMHKIAEGASGGFLDELGGVATAAFESAPVRWLRNTTGIAPVPQDALGNEVMPTGMDAYRAGRGHMRAEGAAMEEQHGTASTLAKLGGGALSAVVPGLGVAKAGGVGAAAGTGAKLGALSGLGASEADLTRGELGGAALDAAVGGAAGAAVGGALHGAGKLLGGARERARGYAAEQLGKAQLDGDEAFQRAAKQWGPLTEDKADDVVRAIKTPGGAKESAEKAVTERAWDQLREGVPNAKKMKIIGQEGRNEAALKGILKEDKPLRQALEKGDSDGALEIVRSRLDAAKAAEEKALQIAGDATDGVQVKTLMSRLDDVRKGFAETTADAPKAEKVFRQMQAVYKQYAEENGGRIPLEQMKREYRGWQDIAYESRRALGPLTDQQEIAEEVARAMRGAMYDEIEHAIPGPLRKTVEIQNKRMSELMGIKNLLVEKSTREHADAPTGVQLFRGIRNAFSEAGQQVARAGEARVARAAARAEASPLGGAIAPVYDFFEQGATATAPKPRTRSAFDPFESQ